MLEAAPAGQLQKWRAYYYRKPWGDDWEQASLVATQIINAIQSVATGMSGKRAKEKDMLKHDAFVPRPAASTPEKKKTSSITEMRAKLRLMAGV